MAEESSNFPREEEVHDKDNDGQDYSENSSEKVEIPGPTKVRSESDHVPFIVGKWKYQRWIVYNDDGIREAGKDHYQTDA